MKILDFATEAVTVLISMSSFVFAAGNAEKGKTLFNDPRAFGGERACSLCHPDGEGLESAGGKKVFNIAGKTQESLEEAVNECIVNASGGKAIDVMSGKMKDIVAYIKSLGKK